MHRTALRRAAWVAALIAPPLATSGCLRPESGVDRTIVKGTVSFPAARGVEVEAAEGANDSVDLAEGLGELRYSAVVVRGECLDAADDRNGVPRGDPDWYAITAAASGPLTVTLAFDGAPADTGGLPGARLRLQVLDAATLDAEGAPTVLADLDSGGAGGPLSVELDVAKGAELRFGVSAGDGEDGSPAYQLQLSGFDPAQAGVLVGAYEGGTWDDRGSPLGGTSVGDWAVDALTLAKTARWTMHGVSRLRPGDPAEVELVDAAWLWAGAFPSLNAGPSSGLLYASNPLEIPLTTDEIVGVDLIIDAVLPRVVGWEIDEVEPNEVELDGDYAIVSGAPMALPEASGPGKTDIVRGVSVFAADDPQWSGDVDAFTVTAPDDMGVIATLSWADDARTLDLNWNGPDGALLGAGWAVLDGNPERFDSFVDFGFALAPGESHTVVILPWSGPAGELPWELTLEWTSP
jgi:hypothetical protein